MSSGEIKVLVVDDSAYNRRTIIRMLEEIPGVRVVDYACDGEEALRKAIDLKPDLITLDLEMPRMDGFTVLRILMQNRPVPVIVVSSRSDDENVFRAMEFGAVTFIPKPSARISPELFDIRDDLHDKVAAIVQTDMNKVLRRSSPDQAEQTRKRIRAGLRKGRKGSDVELVAIGASTGGPPALQKILAAIESPIPVSFVISQHMPPGFTRAFADRLNKFSGLEVKEAENGDEIKPGRVLVAPGGTNLVMRQHGGRVVAKITEPEAGQRYVPSVDVMFKSAAELFGSSVLGVVLTGMGNDGADGTRRIKLHGGKVLAEAEESSVVFGMPKEAIATGDVSQIVTLDEMCDAILRECGF